MSSLLKVDVRLVDSKSPIQSRRVENRNERLKIGDVRSATARTFSVD